MGFFDAEDDFDEPDFGDLEDIEEERGGTRADVAAFDRPVDLFADIEFGPGKNMVGEANKIFVPGGSGDPKRVFVNDPSKGFRAPNLRNVPTQGLNLNVGKAPDPGQAPGPLTQTQQNVSGQNIGRLLQRSNQFEATTGREVTGALTEGLSRAAFGEAADRAAQNKSLALQEQQVGLERFRTQTASDFQKFGLDADSTFKKSELILQQTGDDRNFALAEFATSLQAQGATKDQAFRIAQQAINVQIQNETFRVQREGIEAGISVNNANARAAGQSALVEAGLTLATLAILA